MKVVVTPRGFAKCGLENVKIMEGAGIRVEYNDTGLAYTKEEFYDRTKDADGVIVGVETVDRDYIDAHPSLKAVVKFGVGTDNIDVAYCREKHIFVGRCVGSNSRSVAETAISFIIADSKNLFDSIKHTRENDWAKQTGYELQDKQLGLIGFGAIGKQVAKLAHGLGMKTLAYEPYQIDMQAVSDYHVTLTDFDGILKNADFLSIHVPLTDETRNLISMKEIKQMKPDAILINTARGGIVNEADLYVALKERVIKAAWFDVLVDEPPKKGEALLELPNFYLTPHIASRSREAEAKTASMATQIMIDALK